MDIDNNMIEKIVNVNGEKRKSVAALIKGLIILSDYMENGLDERYFTSAEHDIIYFQVSGDDLPEDSTNGKILVDLGFMLDEDTDTWAMFT